MRKYTVFEIGKSHDYFRNPDNRKDISRISRKCYLPANNLLLKLIKQTKGRFKAAFSISGSAFELLEKYAPDVIDSFKVLAKTGSVEFLSETYYHSLSYLYSKNEFDAQVKMHQDLMEKHFGKKPEIFRNTELIYNNELANHVESLGFKGILAEGPEYILDWRSPNYVYTPVSTKKIKVFVKNRKLSEDVAFRFSNQGWKEWPLTSQKYASWIKKSDGETVNLFMQYEAFGEHNLEDSGIFNFLGRIPKDFIDSGIGFKLPSELIKTRAVSELDVHGFTSWSNIKKDLSSWTGNKMQKTALDELYAFESPVKESGDDDLLRDWRLLQMSDHFYYMATTWDPVDKDAKRFNPYGSPYDSFITFMNVLNDLAYRLNGETVTKKGVNERPSSMIKKRGN